MTVLVIDEFLHWIVAFDVGVENLVITVISIYTIYVYLGEIVHRIEEKQPELAGSFQRVRIGYALLQVLNYIGGAYEIAGIIVMIAISFFILLIAMLIVLFKIEPEDS